MTCRGVLTEERACGQCAEGEFLLFAREFLKVFASRDVPPVWAHCDDGGFIAGVGCHAAGLKRVATTCGAVLICARHYKLALGAKLVIHRSGFHDRGPRKKKTVSVLT